MSTNSKTKGGLSLHQQDVNFVGRNNFANNAYRGNFNPRPFPSNSSNTYGNSYNNSYGEYNKISTHLENNIKYFINYQRISMLW